MRFFQISISPVLFLVVRWQTFSNCLSDYVRIAYLLYMTCILLRMSIGYSAPLVDLCIVVWQLLLYKYIHIQICKILFFLRKYLVQILCIPLLFGTNSCLSELAELKLYFLNQNALCSQNSR